MWDLKKLPRVPLKLAITAPHKTNKYHIKSLWLSSVIKLTHYLAVQPLEMCPIVPQICLSASLTQPVILLSPMSLTLWSSIYLAQQPWESSSMLLMNVYEWSLASSYRAINPACCCVQLEPFAPFVHSDKYPLFTLSVSRMQANACAHTRTLHHPVRELPLVSQGDLWGEAGFVKCRLPPGGVTATFVCQGSSRWRKKQAQ